MSGGDEQNMNLSLERLTKYVALTLVCFALMAALGTRAYGATATATPTLTVTINNAAMISTPNVTFIPPGTIDFTGNYTGTSVLTFSLRASANAGTGSITVQGLADFTGANGGVGPSLNLSDLTYSCAAGDLTPGSPHSFFGALTYCQGGNPQTSTSSATGVLTGIGAKSRTKNAVLNVHWVIPDSASFDADTYTGTVTFTVTAN
jgi:hypothetical protein